MKKIISVLMSGLLAAGAAVPSFASSKDNITVNVDGNKMAIVGHPAVLDEKTGRVLIPFKSLFLAIGVAEKDIKWDAATSTAKGTKEGTVVELTKNNVNAKVDGASVKMDNAPVIMGTSMMVPLSFVSKQMGGVAFWDGAPNYIVNIEMDRGLFPDKDPVKPTPETPNDSKAPARDTGAKNNEIWGTFAINNAKKDKIVAQFKADYSLDIKNITTGKSGKGSYKIKGDDVTITSDILGGSYTLSTTSYGGTTYYILKGSDAGKALLAMAKITYDQFASVY